MALLILSLEDCVYNLPKIMSIKKEDKVLLVITNISNYDNSNF